jgi:hypothetical protein
MRSTETSSVGAMFACRSRISQSITARRAQGPDGAARETPRTAPRRLRTGHHLRLARLHGPCARGWHDCLANTRPTLTVFLRPVHPGGKHGLPYPRRDRLPNPSARPRKVRSGRRSRGGRGLASQSRHFEHKARTRRLATRTNGRQLWSPGQLSGLGPLDRNPTAISFTGNVMICFRSRLSVDYAIQNQSNGHR